MNEVNEVVIYSDGACQNNPGPGGWGALLSFGQYEKTLSGAESMTTSNRMELMAAIAGLEALKRPCRVRLVTDSQYVAFGMATWLPKWKAYGYWGVKNLDLWQRLEAAARPHQVQWEWVRGHSGNIGNERAHQLARQALHQLLQSQKTHRIVALDIETTGLEPERGHRIIEIGCVEIINRRITGREFHHYLNPDREIDPGALRVHGIDAEFLRSQPRFADVAAELLDFLRDAEVIAHNAPFDCGFLAHELKLARWPVTRLEDICTVTDTLALARRLRPNQKNSLDALCQYYRVNRSMRTQHGAALDARLLAEVYLAMTRGQEKLPLETATEDSPAPVLMHGESPPPLQLQLDIPVLRASQEELAAHEAMLDHIQQKTGKPPLWRQIMMG